MKLFYSIFLTTDDVINHKGVEVSTIGITEYLKSIGLDIPQPYVWDIANGKKWSKRVLIVKHLVEEDTLITPSLLSVLKMKAEKEAKRILKERRKK